MGEVLTVLLSYMPFKRENGFVPKDGIQLYSDHIYTELFKAFPNQEIVYVNFQDLNEIKRLKGKRFDFVFGISGNFDTIVKTLKPSVSCLLAVNESALMRRTIRDFSNSKGLNRKSKDVHDGYISNLRETKLADFIIGIGGWAVLQSYLKIGVLPKQVFVSGYPYWQQTEKYKSYNLKNKILFFPGYICTRKGIDYLEEIIEFISASHPNYSLRVVGFLGYSDWRTKIVELCLKFPKNIEFVEKKITYGSDDWKELARNVAFAIFPSHEEGLAGCALDVINLGVPLVHSSKVGIEYHHEALTSVDFELDDWQRGLDVIIRGGPSLWSEISANQRDLSFHINQRYSGIGRAINRLPLGNIWPNVDLRNETQIWDALPFLMRLDQKFDYSLENSSQANIEVDYLGDPLNLTNQTMLSVMLLEKYSNFKSILVRSSVRSDLGIVRVDSDLETLGDFSSPNVISVREYLPANPRFVFKRLFWLKTREQYFSALQKITYWFKRLYKRALFKARLELNRFWNELHSS
jgi:hypothetical protein